ncbi:MAG: DUF4280 domain-containing protein [Lachnospiraceae bacterium]|nr:DUF4280 domain-containing protein [Lachnospiraceae bacterium]
MGQMVVQGGQCMCSFGTAPGGIKVTSQQLIKAGGQTAATIQDAGPQNVGPFGMCTSLANPAVASATAAALGVLTPQPCTPTPAGVWMPGTPTVLVNGNPALNSDCKLMCAYAGSISIVSPGQVTVSV